MELRITEAVAALGDAGLRCIVLKGPSIGRWLYDTTQERSYGDSDLLVAPGEIPAAEKVIFALGYRRQLEALIGDRPWGALYWMRPHDGAALDLHRALTGIEASPETAWLLLSEETELLSLRGVEVEVLNQAARALHLVLHAADHGFSSDRPLKELALALDALPQDLWSRAASLAAKLEASAAFAAGLRLVPEGAELAARLCLPDNDSVEVALRASPATRHALGLQWLLQTEGLGAKASLLVRKLAPPPAYMRAWSRLAQKGGLGLILAYFWRPLYLFLVAIPTVRA
nr:nucleotidyltransferase family protein [Nocardioidaceae bacterium]